MSDFVHLHSHTMYSLLDGGCRIPEIADLAAEEGMPAVAITDHGNLFGAVEFYQQMHRVGVKPIIGCEVYCAIESRFSRQAARGIKSGANHLVLLAKDTTGYKNLVRLVSAGYLEGFYYTPRIDKALLREHSDGLICLSACLSGEIPHLIEREGVKAAREAVAWYQDGFGEDFYLEIQRHGIDREESVNAGLQQLHRETGVPLVATNDSHFLKADGHDSHAILVAIQTGKTLKDPDRMCYPEEIYFKSGTEMQALFKDLPNALETTLEIAEKCSEEITFGGEQKMPSFPMPPDYTDPGSYLTDLARKGLEKRYERIDDTLRRRVAYELDVIKSMGYADYYLIVWDYVRFAKASGIAVGPGRGSGAGSLVAYVLEITDVDPIKYNLLFERMLNPERVSMPDFDVDFSDKDRDKVIRYVSQKYGEKNVCQVITFGTMGAKAAIRDVGRVLDMPFPEVDRIAKLVPNELKMTLDRAIQQVPELKKAAESEDEKGNLLKHARNLEGLARHASVHAAAVIIAPGELTNFVPLYRSPRDGKVTSQYDGESCGELGLLKMDFLGLKELSLADEAVARIRERNPEFDLQRIPEDDQETFDLFSKAHTVGVFQFESSGMRDYLRQFKPDCIEELIAMNALYRPGPMERIPSYIKRKHGREEVTYDHPCLKPILRETYGILVYQEQVMQAVQALAGFSLGQADILRLAMGKKKPKEMEEQREGFIRGCQENGVALRLAEKIFAEIEDFASYAFAKSHAAAYGVVAYRNAYLKTHYPKEYMAASLNAEIGNIDRTVTMVEETRRMGMEVLPPDVNESGIDFAATDAGLRMGMAAVRNVGRGAVGNIVAAREEGGAFQSLFDFCERIDLHSVNRRALEGLICAGAFEALEGNRAQLLAGIDRALDVAQAAQADRHRRQITLFETEGMQTQAEIVNNQVLPDVPPWSAKEQLAREKEMIGFYLSGHPMDRYEKELFYLGVKRLREMEALPEGAKIRLGGLITEVKSHTDRNGKPMAFATLEDLEDSIDLVVFPEAFSRLGEALTTDEIAVCDGRLSLRNGRTSIQLEQIMSIERARETFSGSVNLLIGREDLSEVRLEALKNVLQQHRGRGAFHLHVRLGKDRRTVIRTRRMTVLPSEHLISEIVALTGGRAWVSAENGEIRNARNGEAA